MQTFGIFSTNFDHEYLTKHYIYINKKDEVSQDIKINIKELNSLLKKKSKNVAGTIFLYNPSVTPVEENIEFDGKFCELKFNDMMNIFSKFIRDGYRGKLIEIKYLFNLNKDNIEPTPILEELDADLDRYNSSQLTRYDKGLNYHDYLTMSFNGKFVYFGSTHKHDRHHKEIIKYARNISVQAQKLGKDISFTHDNNYDADECVELAYFLSPLASGKIKEKRIASFKEAFKTNPPTIQKLSQ